ncbi:uncharacterized protein rp1l1a isoform X5 [Stigmatopora argus]
MGVLFALASPDFLQNERIKSCLELADSPCLITECIFQFTPCPLEACYASKETFYTRVDNELSGVKMANHKRSFKSFDALLDDRPQKIGWPPIRPVPVLWPGDSWDWLQYPPQPQ